MKHDEVLELVVSATMGIPTQRDLAYLLDDALSAQRRGYFLPDEDERLRDRYRQYLRLRLVLLSSIAELEPYCNDQ